MAESGVSIDEIQTELFAGSMTGQQMFSASAKIVIPRDTNTDSVRQRLETPAQDIMVDIDIAEQDDR